MVYEIYEKDVMTGERDLFGGLLQTRCIASDAEQLKLANSDGFRVMVVAEGPDWTHRATPRRTGRGRYLRRRFTARLGHGVLVAHMEHGRTMSGR